MDVVRRVAERLGTDYTTAVKIAGERILRLPSAEEEHKDLAEVHRIAAEYRAHLPAGQTMNTDDVYDAAGLPR